MQLTRIELHDFRCFDKVTFTMGGRVVFVQGDNGTGKSSLLEALHYLCYLRSFRTASTRELIRFGKDGFFAKAHFVSGEETVMNHELQVGFSPQKRSVKLNKKVIRSFKELMDHYRIVTLTEDDLFLIKGAPDVRRQFVDQALLLEDQRYSADVKAYHRVLGNRNSLLKSGNASQGSYELWTQQLWERSRVLQDQRITLLEGLEKKVNNLLAQAFKEEITVSLVYKMKNDDSEASFGRFMDNYRQMSLDWSERKFSRSLFGAHLDDILINFRDKKSKQYASRGQQKLVVLLLKVAQLSALDIQRGPAVMLLDDFMTDFDEQKADALIGLLSSLPNQLVFTSPTKGAFFNKLMTALGAQQIVLTERKDMG